MYPSKLLDSQWGYIMITHEDKKTAELIESIAVALLSVRNAKGVIIPVQDPIRYARYIAEDLRGIKASCPAISDNSAASAQG